MSGNWWKHSEERRAEHFADRRLMIHIRFLGLHEAEARAWGGLLDNTTQLVSVEAAKISDEIIDLTLG